jgi:feruloyl-CoA hydratase/lyase
MARANEPWGRHVLVEFDDRIAWVTLNRPEKRNAMNPALHEEMVRVVEALALDERCGVLVLTGAGEAFAAGMDLKEFVRSAEQGGDSAALLAMRRTAEEWQWRRLRYYPKPTIAMVNGWCFGAGLTPVAACDLAVAAEEAQFGLSEINWGALPAANVIKAVSECMGLRQSLYYAMTGKTFSGVEAAAMGFVNRAVPLPALRKETRNLALLLLEKDPAALRGTKTAVKRVGEMDWDTAADYLYAKLCEVQQLGGGKHRDAAMKAFLDEKKFRPGLENFDSD